ncbi:hypothetical protein PGT21_027554 [Puccinia graminis f. sp. tritici]|uniref:Uncharacterized protein n=1 Tax=Puccinia graminis f. sp. tritici TaxID=56615 RepID=A0A5B0QJP4_PUCGR|nr:hypothetical protein PGT21_027554 [Puccinia graminis f. sp. tritici]
MSSEGQKNKLRFGLSGVGTLQIVLESGSHHDERFGDRSSSHAGSGDEGKQEPERAENVKLDSPLLPDGRPGRPQ